MSRKLYESLFAQDSPDTEEVTVHPLLRTFARAAATRRAARDLADEEYLEGAHVEAGPEEVAPSARLAAQDAVDPVELPARYSAGPYVLRLWLEPNGAVLVRQEAGPAGLTLELDGRWHPLVTGRPVDLGTLADVPAALVVIDATGRRWRLVRA